MEQKIIDRINALLTLASNNPSENERALANKQAQKLITKHQITESQLQNAKNQKEDPQTWDILFEGIKNVILWKDRLINRICDVNGVFCLCNKDPDKDTNYTGYGKTSAIKIVKILIDHIINQIEYHSKLSFELKGKSELNSFKLGCAQRICERLSEGKLEAIREYQIENHLTDGQMTNALVAYDRAIVDAKNYASSLGIVWLTAKPRKAKIKENAYQKGKNVGDLIDLNKPHKALIS